jgi:alpha-ketoglutarate-dependent 2,4-dichlorophenoxyacetate dioxygenase
MAISVYPATENFAAEIGDVDLSKPLSTEDLTAIKQAFATYAVLIFPEQQLNQQQHLDFAEYFGPHETSIGVYRTDVKLRVADQIADVSNLNEEGEIWDEDSRLRMFQLGNRLWHTDSSFKYVPAKASLMYARSIPPIGGRTEFADERAAYDDLPDEMKVRLEGLVAEHSIFNSRARLGFENFNKIERESMPPVPQMVVRTHPETGRKNLYLASHSGHILDLPETEGRALLAELLQHATKQQYVYSHRWRVGDLVMWDDSCTMHRGTEFDDLRHQRDVQRATVSDQANSCEMAGVAPPAIEDVA